MVDLVRSMLRLDGRNTSRTITIPPRLDSQHGHDGECHDLRDLFW
jgi:hypothetical protein